MCAALYARLGAWDDVIAIADGVLAIPALSMGPLVRIEAWRLRARGLGAAGEAAGARGALETALDEASAVGYLWMEQVIREELLVTHEAIQKI